MSCAVNNYVNPIYIECNFFSVVPTLTTVTAADGSQSRTLVLKVSFLKDNVFPFTLLSVDTMGLIRKIFPLSPVIWQVTSPFIIIASSTGITSSVVRTQTHSTLPSGDFVLEYTDPNNVTTAVLVPYNADKYLIQNVFQVDISPDINVLLQSFLFFSFRILKCSLLMISGVRL